MHEINIKEIFLTLKDIDPTISVSRQKKMPLFQTPIFLNSFSKKTFSEMIMSFYGNPEYGGGLTLDIGTEIHDNLGIWPDFQIVFFPLDFHINFSLEFSYQFYTCDTKMHLFSIGFVPQPFSTWRQTFKLVSQQAFNSGSAPCQHRQKL